VSLTFGSSPFGPTGDGRFDFAVPDRVRYWEPWPRRMRAIVGHEVVLDSERGLLVHESGHLPVHYFPLEDLRQDLLFEDPAPPDVTRTWSIRVGTRRITSAVGAPPLRGEDGVMPGLVTVDYGAMDAWLEEDDPIYGHPRDPYHRVDVRSSSRRVVVGLGDHVVADSSRPKLLFETANPIRYYLPLADVRVELLRQSETVSRCPYKGDGQHWHLRAGEHEVQDAGWSLPHPLPEGLAAAQHMCFYPEKVTVEVDGRRVGA